MDKKKKLVFMKSEYLQYNVVLSDEEIHNLIAAFLLKYVSLESFYKKLLITYKERNGENLSAKDKKNLSVSSSEVKAVLKYFDISAHDELVERIFGSDDKNYMVCSIKKLRDRLVHNVNEGVLRVILERYETINQDLDAFIALFLDKTALQLQYSCHFEKQ